MERIGVVGPGRIGSQIAGRLTARGAVTQARTRSVVSPDRAASLGISAAPDLSAVAVSSDVLVLSVIDDAAIRDVMAEKPSGKLVIDTSVVSPSLRRARISDVAPKGAAAVDVPVWLSAKIPTQGAGDAGPSDQDAAVGLGLSLGMA